jgi:hypothetical protein
MGRSSRVQLVSFLQLPSFPGSLAPSLGLNAKPSASPPLLAHIGGPEAGHVAQLFAGTLD